MEDRFGEGGGEDVGGIGDEPGPTPDGAADLPEPDEREEPRAPREPPPERSGDTHEGDEPWAKFGPGRDPDE